MGHFTAHGVDVMTGIPKVYSHRASSFSEAWESQTFKFPSHAGLPLLHTVDHHDRPREAVVVVVGVGFTVILHLGVSDIIII